VDIGSVVNFASEAASLLAAAAALGGFVGHARLAIRGAAEVDLRRATALGGLGGIALALGGVLSAEILISLMP
jgi:hypothetical protein